MTIESQQIYFGLAFHYIELLNKQNGSILQDKKKQLLSTHVLLATPNGMRCGSSFGDLSKKKEGEE